MDDATIARWRLEPGQTLLRRLSRGSRISVDVGTVHLVGPPQWLAETIVRGALRITPDAPAELQKTGWVELSSDHGAELSIEPSAARADWVRALLGTLARGRRRRIVATSPCRST